MWISLIVSMTKFQNAELLWTEETVASTPNWHKSNFVVFVDELTHVLVYTAVAMCTF